MNVLQVFKERSSRDSYRNLKAMVAAKLNRQDHMGSHGSGVGSRREAYRPDGLFRSLGRTVAPLSAAVRMPLVMPRLTLDIALANEWGEAVEKTTRGTAGLADKSNRDNLNQGLSSSRPVRCTCCDLYVIEEHPPLSVENEDEIQQVSTGTITPPQCTCAELGKINMARARVRSSQDSPIQSMNLWTKENEIRAQHHRPKETIHNCSSSTSTMEPGTHNRQSVTAEISLPPTVYGSYQRLKESQRVQQVLTKRQQADERKRDESSQMQLESTQRQKYIPVSDEVSFDRRSQLNQIVASVHKNPSKSSRDTEIHQKELRGPDRATTQYQLDLRTATGDETINRGATVPSASKRYDLFGGSTLTDERSGVKMEIIDELTHDRDADTQRNLKNAGAARRGVMRGTVAFSENKTNVHHPSSHVSEHGSGTRRATPAVGARGILTSREKQPSVNVSCV